MGGSGRSARRFKSPSSAEHTTCTVDRKPIESLMLMQRINHFLFSETRKRVSAKFGTILPVAF